MRSSYHVAKSSYSRLCLYPSDEFTTKLGTGKLMVRSLAEVTLKKRDNSVLVCVPLSAVILLIAFPGCDRQENTVG